VSSIDNLHERKISGSGLESREYVRRNLSSWPRTLQQQTLALTSPASCGRSVGIVRARTQATEFRFIGSNFLLRRAYVIPVE
jgi:hypothetical protein